MASDYNHDAERGAAAFALAPSVLNDAPALVERLLRHATAHHASDVHIEPQQDSLRLRLRIDGELVEIARIPLQYAQAIVSRLKVLASLDIAERRAPQDGAFSWRTTDVRIATLPVRHGERITLRLLDKSGGRLTLDALGMSEADYKIFCGVLMRPHGLVLLTGPTGSGKTTTLYAAIRLLLERKNLNILTVEDPVEYEIDGISQAEVDGADKVNFAKALRSLLRHDPDVIMIGEIRDSQSMNIAVRAALTGHLVLSTLHANDSIGAVTRLRDMGLEAHLIAATLKLSVAQRLVKRGGSGGGRIGVFELFHPGEEEAAAIARDASHGELLRMAKTHGFRSLADDLAAKRSEGIVAEGIVD
ncbi:MAG: type II/IV secretion system protein [Kiritimatiellae bacterium]|nr:type II/IV secretion system protein [Kiritimatiellia bacterium]